MSEEPGREEEAASAEPSPEAEGQQEPATLEEAMQAVRANDERPAETDVEPAEEAGEPEGGAEPESAGESTGEPDYQSTESVGTQPDIGGSAGGSAASAEQYNLDSTRQQIAQAITRQAQRDIAQQFQENNVERYTIDRLFNRDERTGAVTFENPDDPNHPFTSRADAQNWIDSINSQIDERYNQLVREKQNEYVQQLSPTIQVLEFQPVFDSMPKQVQDTFDTLIEPYSVYDNQGRLTGFNCDLNAAMQQAQSIDARYASSHSSSNSAGAQTKKKIPATGPATDMRTHGSESSGKSSSEPKNLNDALKIYNESKKKSKKK